MLFKLSIQAIDQLFELRCQIRPFATDAENLAVWSHQGQTNGMFGCPVHQLTFNFLEACLRSDVECTQPIIISVLGKQACRVDAKAD